MSNSKPSLRFDHREVAVLFSLFIFVSLLMFTVGILVGKGLSPQNIVAGMSHTEDTTYLSHEEGDGGEKPAAPPEAKVEAEHKSEPNDHREVASVHAAEKVEKPPEKTPLELVPKTPQVDIAGTSLKEPGAVAATDALLQNPKIRSLIDETPAGKEEARSIASVKSPSTDAPPVKSFEKGAYTIQVGSYPSQREATERVDALKKVGFPYAFFSAKKLVGSQETWYRVWLGYFEDEAKAQQTADWLQKRGEVKNYLVRRSGAEK